MSLLKTVANRIADPRRETMSLEEFLEKAKTDPSLYASPAQRMLNAIGPAKLIDSSKDVRLSRLFGNKVLTEYEPFKDFYGMNETLENIVSYFRHSAQGLEEERQITYLVGSVGTAKSSLATRLCELMETQPIYVLTAAGQLSPIFESPLGLFSAKESEELGIPFRFLTNKISPWAVKRLKEMNNDLRRFTVTKMYPSILNQVAIARVEPGDENNQDQSTIVGKTNMRNLGLYDQNDTDCYSYSGGLCTANQGIMEFVEMFKAPLKLLNPLLTATQEHHYKGTENLSQIPFTGIIVAHSNESEWEKFKNDKTNEAFLDRVFTIRVPYNLQKSEEVKIYLKMLNRSELADKPRTPEVLENLARFAVLTRLVDPSPVSDIYLKLQTYDGENTKEQDKNAKSAQKYREEAGLDEGMSGLSTRDAFKILSKTFNFDRNEIAADNIHLFMVIEDFIINAQLPPEIHQKWINYLTKHLKGNYLEFMEKEIQRAYLDSHEEYGQNLFNRYLALANHWLDEKDYRDSDTGGLLEKGAIDTELSKLEKPAGIINPKEFRADVTRFVLQLENEQRREVNWKVYKKMAKIIEANMFSQMSDIIPIISFTPKESKDEKSKHSEFVKRMMDKGYTRTQVKRAVDWYIQNKDSR